MTCEWCGKAAPSWSAMCEDCAAPLGGLPKSLAPEEVPVALRDINMAEVGRSIQLVGAVYADGRDAFLVHLPGEEAIESPRSVLLDNGEWQAFIRQTDLVEIEALVKDPETKKMAKAIVRKCERQVAKHTSWVVYRRDEYTCRYCGDDQVPLTVDHLVTWESGGPAIPENLVASCSKCNNRRGEMPYADWLMSPYYRKVSKRLDHSVRFANSALVPTLANIPITPLKPGKKRKKR